MKTIGIFCILVALFGWLAGIAGLIHPKLLTDKESGATPSRKVICLGMGILILLFGLGETLLSNNEKPAEATEARGEEPKLNIALSDWIQQMNGQLKKVDRPALTSSTEQKECDVWCTTSYESGKSVGYLVSHRNGRIHEIVLVASGDGTAQSGGEIMLGFLAMTHVLSTGISKQEISKKTVTLLDRVLETGKAEATISAVKYNASKIDGVGLFLSATKPD